MKIRQSFAAFLFACSGCGDGFTVAATDVGAEDAAVGDANTEGDSDVDANVDANVADGASVDTRSLDAADGESSSDCSAPWLTAVANFIDHSEILRFSLASDPLSQCTNLLPDVSLPATVLDVQVLDDGTIAVVTEETLSLYTNAGATLWSVPSPRGTNGAFLSTTSTPAHVVWVAWRVRHLSAFNDFSGHRGTDGVGVELGFPDQVTRLLGLARGNSGDELLAYNDDGQLQLFRPLDNTLVLEEDRRSNTYTNMHSTTAPDGVLRIAGGESSRLGITTLGEETDTDLVHSPPSGCSLQSAAPDPASSGHLFLLCGGDASSTVSRYSVSDEVNGAPFASALGSGAEKILGIGLFVED